eukprot:ANDGO_00377.mRNA.1 TBC1 domain family member 5 homolog B
MSDPIPLTPLQSKARSMLFADDDNSPFKDSPAGVSPPRPDPQFNRRTVYTASAPLFSDASRPIADAAVSHHPSTTASAMSRNPFETESEEDLTSASLLKRSRRKSDALDSKSAAIKNEPELQDQKAGSVFSAESDDAASNHISNISNSSNSSNSSNNNSNNSNNSNNTANNHSNANNNNKHDDSASEDSDQMRQEDAVASPVVIKVLTELEMTEEEAARLRRAAAEGKMRKEERQSAWMLFLGLWHKPVDAMDAKYKQLTDMYLVNPEATEEDHPLAQSDNSKWAKWFDIEERRKEIFKDLLRLHPGNPYFEDRQLQNVMCDMLLFWSLEHKNVGYRQGMHEILSYIFMTTLEPTQNRGLVYAMFESVMAKLAYYYKEIPSIENLVRQTDPALYTHLFTQLRVEPQFYLIRWLRLLWGREYPVDDVLCLWDFVLNDPSLIEHVCVAMLVFVRSELLDADSSTAMKFLMKFPSLRTIDGGIHNIMEMAALSSEGRRIASYRAEKEDKKKHAVEERMVAEQHTAVKLQSLDATVRARALLEIEGRKLEGIIDRLQKSIDIRTVSESVLFCLAELKQMRDTLLYNISDP